MQHKTNGQIQTEVKQHGRVKGSNICLIRATEEKERENGVETIF